MSIVLPPRDTLRQILKCPPRHQQANDSVKILNLKIGVKLFLPPFPSTRQIVGSFIRDS